MNGRERILTALEVREPDRVPLYIHGINEKPIIWIARTLTDDLPEEKEIYEMNDTEQVQLLNALFLLHEEYGVDGFTCFEIGDTVNIDETHIRDPFNVVYERSPVGIPVATEHPIHDMDDLKKYQPPKPAEEHLLLLNLARDRFKDTKAIFWMMRGSFVRSWRLCGMENLMFKMFDDPQFVHDLAKKVLEFNLASMEQVHAAGADVLIVEDDIADKNMTLVSTEQFLEFINPYNRVLVEEAHRRGMKVMRHSDGNLWNIMDILLDTGYDGLNPLEPQADMGLKKVKDYCGDRLCLIGNIDCIELLPSGTPEEVDQAVKQAIMDAGQGGGLVISSSNSLHPGTKPENCIAMFKAVEKYGKYPLQDVKTGS